MSRFSIALIRLATLALLGSAGTAVYAQQTIDQNKALAGNITPGDAPGFPITLSVPGHYKLMGNLQVPQGTIGIQILGSQVTLDLNGFTISGPNSCTQAVMGGAVTCSLPANLNATGINAPIGTQNVVIRNGRVHGMQGPGVSLRGLLSVVTGMHASMNGGDGFTIFDGQVQQSQAGMNAGTGFSGSNSLQIIASVASRNGVDGFHQGVVQESMSTFNFRYGANSRVRGVFADGNTTKNFGPAAKSMGGNMSESTPF